MINKAFNTIAKIDDQLDVDVMEISVKRSQIELTFFDELIVNMSDLNKLNQMGDQLKVTDVTCYQNRLFVSMRGINGIESLGDKSIFKPLYEIIMILKDYICECPALEYVISKEYIKVFLDLPNVKLSDLQNLTDIFKQDPFIEFSNDRPYLLFFNEALYAQEE